MEENQIKELAEEKLVQDYKQEMSQTGDSQEIKWGGWLNEFLWICAGVNRKFLRQYPSEYAKHAGIGGTILLTAMMAVCSGGYALYFVFKDTFLALLFGIFWGVLIFNFDRLVVNTMVSGNRFINRFLGALPRIIMAIFLGMVVATPLEMKLFEDKIDKQLKLVNIERSEEEKSKANVPLESAKRKLNTDNAKLQLQKDKLDAGHKTYLDKKSKADEDLKNEEEGTASSGKPGQGPIYRAKKEYLERVIADLNKWEKEHEKEYADIDSKMQYNDSIIKSLDAQIAENNKMYQTEAIDSNGFSDRYHAFAAITSEDDLLNLVSKFIWLLFVIIEISPAFLRMIMTDGVYEHRIHVLSELAKSKINDKINTDIQISTAKNQQRLETEVHANREVMEKVAKAQAELLSTSIEKWREEELAKINKNPSAYIKTNNKS